MDWTFIEIHDHASLSYEEFFSKVLPGEFSYCTLKEIVFPRQNIKFFYGLLLTSYKDIEQIEEARKLLLLKRKENFQCYIFHCFVSTTKNALLAYRSKLSL